MTATSLIVERPLVMSSESIRATRAGRKRQTRRLAKLPPAPGRLGRWEASTTGGPGVRDRRGVEAPVEACIWHTRTGASIVNPIGRPGDRLWVKERWAVRLIEPCVFIDPSEVRGYGGGEPTPGCHLRSRTTDAMVVYAADPASRAEFDRLPGFTTFRSDTPASWRNPRFMPRWASRMLLEIVETRAQRLQEITEADAIAEGVVSGVIPATGDHPPLIGYVFGEDDGKCVLYPTAREAYATAWDRLNGNRATWASDPLVFATTFKVIEAR